jgi:CheY-like chemotaxis protein
VTILFLTNDLMFTSRVAGAAAKLGAALEIAGSDQLLLEKLIAASERAVVVLDLNASGVDPLSIVPKLRAAERPPRAILSYGPHVHEQRLAAAKTAGCDEVFSRGQFNAQMDEILGKWLA